MSHFSVLVIGENVEKLLAPYHEFECTGIDDEYVQTIDITDRFHADYEKHGDGEPFEEWCSGWNGMKAVAIGEQPSLDGDHKYGYIQRQPDGTYKVFDRTNPNKKWDFWTVGGRWPGLLKNKAGARVNQCAKKDVDWEAMEREYIEDRLVEYDLVHSVIAGRTFDTWGAVLARHTTDGKVDIYAARKEYNDQPVVKDLYADSETRWLVSGDAGQYLLSREQFVERKKLEACRTYAVVTKDGKWHEKGEMGWFGMSRNEKPEDEWSRQFRELVDKADDNDLLTVVDCHI